MNNLVDINEEGKREISDQKSISRIVIINANISINNHKRQKYIFHIFTEKTNNRRFT